MIGGGAYVLGKRAARGQAQEEDQNAQIAQLQSQQAAAPAAPAASVSSDDLINQLERLGKLRDEGILTPAEFEAQKKKLLEAT